MSGDGTAHIFRLPPSAELSNGWDLTRLAMEAEPGGLEFDYYGAQFGHVMNGILGEKPPDDGRWFWALYVYGSYTGQWARATTCADLVDLDTNPHIAWVALRVADTEQSVEQQRIMRLLGAAADPER